MIHQRHPLARGNQTQSKWLPNYLTHLCCVLPWLSTYCVTFTPDGCSIICVYLEPVSVCFICLIRLLYCRWGSTQAWLEWALNLNKRSLVTLCFSPCAGRALMSWWFLGCVCCLESENDWWAGRMREDYKLNDQEKRSCHYLLFSDEKNQRTQQYCQVGS